MKSIDIRSESAVKLLAEFLDDEEGGGYVEGERSVNAEHFAHGAIPLVSALQTNADTDYVLQKSIPTSGRRTETCLFMILLSR
jgi:hypothetical protein